MRLPSLSFILILCLFTQRSDAQINLNIQSKYQSFNQPLALEHAGDENIYVVEKEGTIIVINTITGLRSTYLDIKNKVSTNANERGLLGLAFDPDFQNNGYFFVNYTNNSGIIGKS